MTRFFSYVIAILLLLNNHSAFADDKLVITEIEPKSPMVGSEFKIKGKFYGYNDGKVRFANSTTLIVHEWHDDVISATVPYISDINKTSGELGVANDGKEEVKTPITFQLLRTDRPYYVEFFAGVEYTLQSKKENNSDETQNFSAPYEHYGLKVNQLIGDHGEWKVRNSYSFRLTSLSAKTENGGEETKRKQSYELGGTIAAGKQIKSLSIMPFSILEPAAIIKVTGNTKETADNIAWRTAGGVRFLQAGTLFNGAYCDFGYGWSDNLGGQRVNIEAYLPINYFKDGGIFEDVFISTNIETDFGNKLDTASIVMGVLIKPEKLIELFKNGN